MSNDDFYTESVQAQLDRIDYQRQRALAEIAEAKATGDTGSGATAVQDLADLTVARENVLKLHQGYVASQKPPPPPPQSAEEWRVKPAEKMDFNDAYLVAAKSKYGVDVEAFKAGVAEVQRRRARGE